MTCHEVVPPLPTSFGIQVVVMNHETNTTALRIEINDQSRSINATVINTSKIDTIIRRNFHCYDDDDDKGE